MNKNHDGLEKYFDAIKTTSAGSNFESRLLLSLQKRVAAKKRFRTRIIAVIASLSAILVSLLAMIFIPYIPQEVCSRYFPDLSVDFSFVKELPVDFLLLFVSFAIMLSIYFFAINNQKIKQLKRLLELKS